MKQRAKPEEAPAPKHGALASPVPPPGADADWTVPQHWDELTAEDHWVWDTLFARQQTLLRLCAEAIAQDAEPTVGDLAEALGVTPRTVDRDIAALRAAGETLVTRGGGG